jgi:hypothetical protein
MADTATKAHGAGIGAATGTLILYWVAPEIGLVEVTPEQATEAFHTVWPYIWESVISSGVVGVVTWLATYFSPKNRSKV